MQVKSCVDSSCNCKSYGAGGTPNNCDGDADTNDIDTDDIHKSEFIGPGGDGTTYFSELYNRTSTDINFDCELNAPNDPGVCRPNEITLSGSSKPTGPEFLNIDYSQFLNPSPNRYARYRIIMEADENTACDGEPCLPELTSVNLNPSGVGKYFGLAEIKPTAPINYVKINGIEITAEPCATYQLSNDGTSYFYWDGSNWSTVTTANERSSQVDLESYITNFGDQFGPGQLFIKIYLESTPDQTSNCSVNDINLDFTTN